MTTFSWTVLIDLTLVGSIESYTANSRAEPTELDWTNELKWTETSVAPLKAALLDSRQVSPLLRSNSSQLVTILAKLGHNHGNFTKVENLITNIAKFPSPNHHIVAVCSQNHCDFCTNQDGCEMCKVCARTSELTNVKFFSNITMVTKVAKFGHSRHNGHKHQKNWWSKPSILHKSQNLVTNIAN